MLTDEIAESIELYNHDGTLVQLDYSTGKLISINRDALHRLIDKHIAAVRVVNHGTKGWQREYYSYGFAHGADTRLEPDAKVLDQIYRHELSWRIPKVKP